MVVPGLEFTATMRGAVYKHVVCQQCQLEYVYPLSRAATGSDTTFLFFGMQKAQERAHEAAKATLFRKLVRGVEVAPCPRCGWIQAHMVRRARNLRGRWLSVA